MLFNVKETEVVTFQTFNKEAVSAKVYTGLTPLSKYERYLLSYLQSTGNLLV
jgi:hypothetical protein